MSNSNLKQLRKALNKYQQEKALFDQRREQERRDAEMRREWARTERQAQFRRVGEFLLKILGGGVQIIVSIAILALLIALGVWLFNSAIGVLATLLTWVIGIVIVIALLAAGPVGWIILGAIYFIILCGMVVVKSCKI